MTDDEPEPRNWLGDALGGRRRAALEETLFRQLEELEQGPLERLGALVHLVIAELRAAQRRLTEQALDLRNLQQTVATLAERVEQLETAGPAETAPPQPVAQGHLLLLSTAAGYRLALREGPPPPPGATVDHDGAAYVVLRSGGSPLPGDRRPCLLALPSTRT